MIRAGNPNEFSRRNVRKGAVRVKSILSIVLALSATTLGISQDVERFEQLWSFGLGPVVSVDYSPDGSKIAIGGSSTVFIVNATSYEIEKQLFGHTDLIWSVRWSPDGRYLASSASDRDPTIKIWEAETGNLVRTLQGHTRRVTSVTWSPDGNYLASGSYDFTIRIWEVKTGNLITTISIGAPLNAVAWSPNGNYLASGSADNIARIWEAQTGNLVRELRGHTSGVTSVAWSPDGNYLASGGHFFDGTIRIWEVESWQLVHIISGLVEIDSVAWSPNGNYLAAGRGASGFIWEVENWNLIRRLVDERNGGITDITWSRDSNFIASGGSTTVILWEAGTGDLIITLQGHTGMVMAVTWSPDGRYIASGADASLRDRSIKVWDMETRSLASTIRDDVCQVPGGVFSVEWSPSERYLASSDGCGFIRLWDLETRKEIWRARREVLSTLSWSPDSRYLAARDNDNGIVQTTGIWEVETGKRIRTLNGAGISVVWSPSGRYLAAVGGRFPNFHIRIWDPETGELVRMIDEPNRVAINALAWSPDSRFLASGGGDTDGPIKIWDVETGNLVQMIQSGPISSLSWRADGKYLASGARSLASPTIKIWEVETGGLILTFLGHADIVSSVKWSPDGSYLAPGSWDSTVRLWGENRERP